MKYPIGVQNFEDLRLNRYVYVDKTHLVHRLACTGKYYFLCRPRRFGKSLLGPTLEAYFRGQKHLFEGLAIEKLETEWKEYPVLHFDLNAKRFDTIEDLYDLVGRQLERYELQYGTVAVDQSLDGRFYNLIMSIADTTGRKVVVRVDEYDSEFDLVTLGFPNKEVERGFLLFLLPFYTSVKKDQSNFFVSKAVQALKGGNAEEFITNMTALFADYPYDLVRNVESHYQNVVYLTLKLMSVYVVDAEYRTSAGRIDLLIKTDRYIYVMEFKYNGTAQEAIDQIESKGYALPFINDSREVIKVGVNFDGATRNIAGWIIR